MQKDLLTHIMRLHSRWPKWPFSRDFYSAVASVLALMGFCFCAIADVRHVIKYAPSPSYDSIPITPKTWEEVDLIYYSTIYGHRYTNTIQLLRPIAWLHTHHMDIIGSKVTLSMPEFGIVNVMATVKAIKPTQIDTCGVDWSKQKSAPVIGKFMRYVTDVRTYTFKDSLGHISHINATPNHPFYVKNKHGFVAIGNVSVDDALVGGIGSGENHIDGTVHLVCAKGKHSHCGANLMGGDPPVTVYNLEVYKRHIYRVGGGEVLVHNVCDGHLVSITDRLPENARNDLLNLEHNLINDPDEHIVSSYYMLEEAGPINTEFVTSFSAERWTFLRRYKNPGRLFHASDAIRSQYLSASKVSDFNFSQPKELVSSFIENAQTLNVLEGVTEGTQEFLNKFLCSTPLGKCTQRIMDDFMLQPLNAKWLNSKEPDDSKSIILFLNHK